MSNQEIATTILNQLGGFGRLNAMLGIKDLFAVENGVRFKIKVRGAKANYIKITLNSLDLYDVELGKLWGSKYKVIKKAESIYADMLKDLIEDTTGCYLSL